MIYSKEQLSFKNEKLCIILGGVAGIGKTTLALSAPKPLLIDLDNGIKRVAPRFRKDTDIVSSYEELINDLNGDLSAYETIVVDTGGRLLEFLKPVVIKENINANYKSACIINKSNDINLVFFSIRSFEIRTNT